MNILKEKENELRSELAFVQTQLDELRKGNKKLWDEKDKNRRERDSNNRIVSGVGINTDDKHWLWDFITLENILILGGCYAMYRLLKEDKIG